MLIIDIFNSHSLCRSQENLVDSDMRDVLNSSPQEEENNRSPISAEAPELSSQSSEEVNRSWPFVSLSFFHCVVMSLRYNVIFCT
jgi:hypothetical protein